MTAASCGFISDKSTATDVGGIIPSSVTMPLTNSEGVTSYNKFRTLNLGDAADSPPWFPFDDSSASGSPNSFCVIDSSWTLFEILYDSQQTSTVDLWPAEQQPLSPTRPYILPLLIKALAPKKTFVTCCMAYVKAFSWIYPHGIPNSSSVSKSCFPSMSGR
eukprot:CAMPEP_0178859262 /NCGR_PEP_ID=MMETSP0747-20121128/1108_1 /TAXON_ID=913974 /ORGANISM="Nitzschia punctata, Strain CCMP561" /LENGTH=160 /DNA_ID=CAMNT_0020525621 /DNA_START=122 /DNA_END=599 /DNA_ORIENTATION=+